jgi:hypothetical protein
MSNDDTKRKRGRRGLSPMRLLKQLERADSKVQQMSISPDGTVTVVFADDEGKAPKGNSLVAAAEAAFERKLFGRRQ